MEALTKAVCASFFIAAVAGCAGGADFGVSDARPSGTTGGGAATIPEASAPGEGIYNDNTVTGDGTRTSM